MMLQFAERGTRRATEPPKQKLKPKFNSLDTIREALASYETLSAAESRRISAECNWRDEKFGDTAKALRNEANAAEAELKLKADRQTVTPEDVERFIAARAKLRHAEDIEAALAIAHAPFTSLSTTATIIDPVRKAIKEHALALFPNDGGLEKDNYQWSALQFGLEARQWNLFGAEEMCRRYLEAAEKLAA